MTRSRTLTVALSIGAVLLLTGFAPLEVHLGDSITTVDAKLGKSFKRVPAIKMTDATRRYERGAVSVYVSFKRQNVCSLSYSGHFTEPEITALLAAEAPADQWQPDDSIKIRPASMRFYRTLDDRLVAHVTDKGLSIVTREVNY